MVMGDRTALSACTIQDCANRMSSMCQAVGVFVLVAGSGGVACTEPPSAPYCEETVTYLSSPDDLSPSGQSAARAIELIEGTHSSTLAYSEGANHSVRVGVGSENETTGLEMHLEPKSGGLRWIDSRAVYPANNCCDIAISCPSRFEVDAVLTFQTDDGVFHEQLGVVVYVFDMYQQADIWQSIPLDDFAGSFRAASFDPPAPTQVECTLSVAFPLDDSVSQPSGTLRGTARYEGGHEGVFDVGAFGVEVGR